MEFKHKWRSSRANVLAVLMQKHCSVYLQMLCQCSSLSVRQRGKIIKAFTKMVMQARATQFWGHSWLLTLLISIYCLFSLCSDHLWYTPAVPYLTYKGQCFVPQICTDLGVIYLTLLYSWRPCHNQYIHIYIYIYFTPKTVYQFCASSSRMCLLIEE